VTLPELIGDTLSDALLRRQARLVELASDAIFVRDLDARILYWNAAAETLYGWSRAEALGQVAHDLLRTEFPRPLPEIEAAVIRDGRWAGELYHHHRDGGRVVVWSRWSLERDDAGQPLAILALNANVTEHHELEEKRALAERLRASLAELAGLNARYQALFEGVSDPIVITDEQGQFLDANPAALQLLGYPLERLRELNLASGALVGLGSEFAHREFDRLRREGHWHGELEVRRIDGTLVPIEASVAAVTVPGGRVYLGTWRDVSRRRELERLQQEFIAQVSHELKHPLTPMKGYAQLMQRRQTYNEQAITTILAQIDYLDRIINDLLEASRLGAGRLELRRAPVDLVALLRASAVAIQGATQRHTVRVEAPDQPLVGWWDLDRLRQVFQNLLSNAVKYSPRGGEIVVRVEDEGAAARVMIVDQGQGIAADALPRLFDRFYRGAAAARTRVGGLGLGLHISRALVEAHGGRIWAESEGPGHGTTFVVVLPRGMPEAMV